MAQHKMLVGAVRPLRTSGGAPLLWKGRSRHCRGGRRCLYEI